MEHKTWDVYIEFQGQPMYAEYFDDQGDMDEYEVIQEIINNLHIEVSEVEG
jgi:hypothetical protein